jgi:hypothetical protein
MLRLDHLGYAVRELDAAGVRFREEFGLDSVVGGRHVGFGTANRIVPLGDQYIEIVGVVDRAEAEGSAFGRSILTATVERDAWLVIVAATDELDAISRRLGLAVDSGVRVRPDGREVRWRMVGLDAPEREPWMPFFIAWDMPEELHPGRQRAGHGVRAEGLAWVEVGGDPERLRAWLGGLELPIRVTDEPPGIVRAAVATADGEIVID